MLPLLKSAAAVDLALARRHLRLARETRRAGGLGLSAYHLHQALWCRRVWHRSRGAAA